MPFSILNVSLQPSPHGFPFMGFNASFKFIHISTILGTLAIVTDDPDNPEVEEEDINDMVEEGSISYGTIFGLDTVALTFFPLISTNTSVPGFDESFFI